MTCGHTHCHADYGFEYSDEDVQEEDVDIENQYYNSKGERLKYQYAAGPISPIIALRQHGKHNHMSDIPAPVRLSYFLWSFTGLLEGEPQEALKGFQEVISMEGEQGEWHVPSIMPPSQQTTCLSQLMTQSTQCYVRLKR